MGHGWDGVPPPVPTEVALRRPKSTPVTDGDMRDPAVWWRRDGGEEEGPIRRRLAVMVVSRGG